MKRFSAALAAALALVPVVTAAAVISVSPPTLVLQIGGKVFGKVNASAASSHLALAPSTCFSTAGSPRDILRATGVNKSESGKFTTLSVDTPLPVGHPHQAEPPAGTLAGCADLSVSQVLLRCGFFGVGRLSTDRV